MQNNLNDFVKNVLYCVKCLEYHIENGREIINGGLKHKDKDKFNNAIKKIDIIINDILDISKNKESIFLLKQHLKNYDFTNQMVLIENILNLKEEYLDEIVDLIETYLKIKTMEDKPLNLVNISNNSENKNIKSISLLNEVLEYINLINKFSIIANNDDLKNKIENHLSELQKIEKHES